MNAVGRPTKYLPEAIYPKIEEYLAQCSREQTRLPTIEGLALFLGIDDDTVVEWGKKSVEFSAAIKKIKMLQKEQLMNDSFYGGKEVNAGAGVFMLKANHGMKENDPSTLIQVNVQPILSELKAE